MRIARLLLPLLGAIAACGEPPPADGPSTSTPVWCEAAGKAFGTTWTAKWSAEACDPEVPASIDAVLATVDAQMSTWRDDSELSRVRRADGPLPVSADTAFVVRDALALAETTEGAFDPTVQPLMEVWGFHQRERQIAAPDPAALAAARDQVGWQKVQVATVDGRPTLDAGGTALDLSAIAKGHAVDRVSAVLSARGYADTLVEIGGEVRVTGRGPRGTWTFGVDAPVEGNAPGQDFAAILKLTDRALATSGDYRNLVVVEGRKVHHTMDPRTGQPAVSDVASASVVARDCRTADGWATAMMVLGAERGLALIEQRSDLEALLITSGPEGFEQHTSSGMTAFLAED
jgi:thiamine biosynthesis lipoprotein